MVIGRHVNGSRIFRALGTLWFGTILMALSAAAEPIAIVLPEVVSSPEAVAAQALSSNLAKLYPGVSFPVVTKAVPGGRCIYLGTPESASELADRLGADRVTSPESYVVSAVSIDGRPAAAILGADPAGVAYGVYGLLEHLGFGFYLSLDTAPAPRRGPFSFDEWDLEDRPLTPVRLVFNWHNFLSGCTGWDFEHWERWVVGSQQMGFNTVMVHAYGNNPMFTFSFNGVEKPVGYVCTTRRGRDWGNQHVNDVRRLPGGEIFDAAEFGCQAALAPDGERVEAKQRLMQRVFTLAEERGVGVCFALDVDIVSMLPQDMLKTLSESACFHNGSLWLPLPDTDEGYRFYKAQVDALFELYPQIDVLALWRRSHAQEWGRLKKPGQLPESWRPEYEQHIEENPEAGKLNQAVAGFALNKVVGAFRRALDERGREDVRIGMGSWETSWVPACAEFLHEDVLLMPLDSSYIRYRRGSFFKVPDAFADLETARGRVLPILWAHHDDGEYIGRAIHPHANFHDTLSELGARGYGVIHWMTRPLDLYFKNHENQVWAKTQNEPYHDTCAAAGRHWFGDAHAERLGGYLHDWWTDAPIFGRVTTDHFFLDGYQGREHIPAPEKAMAGCRERIARLEAVDTSSMTPAAQERLRYFKALEELLVLFCEVQELAYRPAAEAIQSRDYAQARTLLRSADPADTIRRFARLSQMAGGDRGEEAMVVSLGTRWITDYLAAAQATGLEPVRIRYAPITREPLAQGSGSYSFHIDEEGGYWSVRGARETKGTVTDRGLLVDSTTTLTISPIVRFPGLFAPGRYALTLVAAGGEGKGGVDVKVLDEPAASVSCTFDPVRARFLRVVCRGNNENDWNSIREIACNALLREGATASAAVGGHDAAQAVDGKAETRWAAEGRAQWIRFPLKPDVSFDRVEIAWYQGETRTYDFDLTVSDDGAQWRKIDPRRPDGASGRLASGEDERSIAIPFELARPGLVRVTLSPVDGGVVLRRAVLTRVTEQEEPATASPTHRAYLGAALLNAD